MVKVNNFGQPQPNQQANFNQTNAQFQSNSSQNQPNQAQFQEQPIQKGLISIPPSIMQIIP
jgi:hypothetical protein